MRMLAKPVLCLCVAATAFAAAGAAKPVAQSQDHGQDAASERRLRGQGLSVREIERRVIPRMPGAQYLGFDFDPATNIYTLKFLRNGSVIWVDVDSRTGRIIRRTGS
jgi:hypothetical protein